ncbi:MAG: UbiX family flavin prenyltransferase [Planctomycetota bacterium]
MPDRPNRIVVAVTGASGALYAQRVLGGLLKAKVETHLVVSLLGRRLIHDELGITKLDQAGLGQFVDGDTEHLVVHNYNDVGSSLASGSFLHDGMIVIPASGNTLAEIAAGLGGNLIARAAAVTLKEGRRLIVCHREMPPSAIDVRNYRILSEAGVILASPNPGFYLNPQTVGEVVDFVAGKLLDLVGVEHDLDVRWDPGNPRKPLRFVGGKLVTIDPSS